MNGLVVYESMYGNTHAVASHIASGLGSTFKVTVVPVGEASPALVGASELLVVGGPTHVHGLSSATSRKAAVQAATKEGNDLSLDEDAAGPGLRGWFDGIDQEYAIAAAAFDTRIDASALLTGRASRGIARRLRQHGFRLTVQPESFLVDKENHLLAGEAERAELWGAALGSTVSSLV